MSFASTKVFSLISGYIWVVYFNWFENRVNSTIYVMSMLKLTIQHPRWNSHIPCPFHDISCKWNVWVWTHCNSCLTLKLRFIQIGYKVKMPQGSLFHLCPQKLNSPTFASDHSWTWDPPNILPLSAPKPPTRSPHDARSLILCPNSPWICWEAFQKWQGTM